MGLELCTDGPAFTFKCDVMFPLGEKEIDTKIDVHGGRTVDESKPHQKGHFDIDASGTMKIDTSTFKLEFHKGEKSTTMEASWHVVGDSPFNLQNLIGLLDKSKTLPIPKALDLALQAVIFKYDRSDSSVVLAAAAQNF